MISMIDHVVILVRDLEQAIQTYTDLGFTVQAGGTHADGITRNALIVFADGSYLELLHFLRPAPQHRWWRHVAYGEGLIDFALLPTDTTAAIATAQQHGLALAGPIAGGRLRPDGQQVAWEIALPPTPDLPFLCGDVTPRHLRVAEGDVRIHANGVQGIAGVTVAVPEIGASVQRYRALLDLPHHPASPTEQMPPLVMPELGAQIAMLPIGRAVVMLVQPGGVLSFTALDDTSSTPMSVPLRGPVSTFLETRGAGLYGLALWQQSSPNPRYNHRLYDLGSTHGVRIELVPMPNP